MELYSSYFTGIKAVLFDFDGTLYDFRNLSLWIITRSFSDLLIVKAERETRKMLRGIDFESEQKFYDSFFSTIALKTGNTKEFIHEWYFSTYLPRLVSVLQRHYKAREGTAVLFEELKKSAIRCVVYSDYALVSHRLEAIGLNPEQCGIVYCSEKLGSLKPSPRAAKIICEDLHLSPHQILMVGDRGDTDIAFAKNSGMKYIQIKTHKTKRSEKDPNLMDWETFFACFMQFIKANPAQIIPA